MHSYSQDIPNLFDGKPARGNGPQFADSGYGQG
jgi:hypothetical protein